MKKQDQALFQIGEITKTLGITRKTLLVYEDVGLLTPALRNEDSGYRYYSADNMMQIRAIRSLQKLGLSLKEIGAYYYDTNNLDTYLQKLMELRDALDRNIQMLEVRAARRDDLTVRKITLPHQVCFCRRHRCRDISEASQKLRETYIDAIRSGKSSNHHRMFTMRMAAAETLDIMCCIPVESGYDGPERVEFAETPALCIYFRGPYEGLPRAMGALMEYVEKNKIEIAGPFRSVYLEGPPNHGENSQDYITQVAVPIKQSDV